MNMLLHWEYLIAGRPRDHKGWDGNGGIPAQHTPVNGSREIGRGVGYRKSSEQLSGYPTIQSAMEGVAKTSMETAVNQKDKLKVAFSRSTTKVGEA